MARRAASRCLARRPHAACPSPAHGLRAPSIRRKPGDLSPLANRTLRLVPEGQTPVAETFARRNAGGPLRWQRVAC